MPRRTVTRLCSQVDQNLINQSITLTSTPLQWPTTIFFAINLQLGFLLTDMRFGNRLHGLTLRVSAMLVTLARADSTVSSIFCCPQMIHPIKPLAFQITTNRSSPESWNMSYLVNFLQTTFVRLESLWIQTDRGIRLQGRQDLYCRCRVTHILSDQMIPGRSCFHAEGSKAQYYHFQYKPIARIPHFVKVLESG